MKIGRKGAVMTTVDMSYDVICIDVNRDLMTFALKKTFMIFL